MAKLGTKKGKTPARPPAHPFGPRDWDGLAGATRWSEGPEGLPVIRGLNSEWFATADREGVSLSFCTMEAEDWFELGIAFPNQASALLFLDALPTFMHRKEAERLGFKVV